MFRALLLALVLTSTAHAQLSGGSFGGSGDFGGGSSSRSHGSSGSSWGGGSSGSSSWGGGSSSNDWAERERERAEEREQRAEEERRRAEEAQRRREEEARRRAEEEERRRIEAARQLAEDLALPPRRRASLSRRFHTTEAEVELPRTALGDPPPLYPTRLPDTSANAVPPPGFRYNLLWSVVCGLLGFASFAGVFRAFGRVRNRPRPVRRGSCELRRISLAFDPSERPAIQAALANMAQRLDLRSSEGRLQAAQEVVSMLLQRVGAVRYAVWTSAFVSPQAAKGRLHGMLNDLKSRYRYDVTRGDRVDVRARAEEGDGLVVVSLVVGATRWLPALPDRLGHSQLAQALRGAVWVSARDFVAVEVIWSPAVETDRMSSLELETIYPELLRLDEGRLGRAACAHCRAVHAAELTRCPACGAPTGATGAYR